MKRHVIADIDLRVFGGSSLTADIAVPKHDAPRNSATTFPRRYVPARNTIFLSFALAYAETVGAQDIFIGVNPPLDYSSYPDCRPGTSRHSRTWQTLAKAGVEGQRLTIHTPLITMTKAEIIATGLG